MEARRKKLAGETSAFTLIELLVVIAIIGILAGLILSALSRAKTSAMRTQCLSQTKQLALALQMYPQDNHDAIPWPNWGTAFSGWLYTPVNGEPPEPSEAAYAGGALWQYLKDTRIYRCPTDRTNTSYFAARPEKLSSYIMNGAVMGYYRDPETPRTHRLADMNPSAFATWEPSDQPPYDPELVFNDGASYPIEDEGPAQRHGSGCNVSSFDGHVELLKSSDFQREQNDQPGLLWCDPDTSDGTGGKFGHDCKLWQ